jgi:Na+-transporting NADH:ubiquinone oxidoreductase subunit NqrD
MVTMVEPATGIGRIQIMAMTIDPTFVLANRVEAGLWFVLAMVVIVAFRSSARVWLAASLVLFGFSDLVETRTGAWYRPAWLLVWKGLCVVLIVTGFCVERRFRARRD